MYTNVRTIGTFETIVLDFIDRNEGKSVNCHRGLMLHGYDKNTIIPIKSFIHTNATNKYLALALLCETGQKICTGALIFFALSFGIKINDVHIPYYIFFLFCCCIETGNIINMFW